MARGAYGLELELPDGGEWLMEIPPGADPARLVRVESRSAEPSPAPNRIDRESADFALVGGERAAIDREAGAATLLATHPVDDGRIVHPFLAAVGAAFAWWDGNEPFHGGAVLGAEGAWLVLGDRDSGKSSVLAVLAGEGYPVLADDLVVVAGGRALAGPRCLDLRADTAERLGLETSPVRGGERRRRALSPVEWGAPLRGWLFLTWSDRIELVPIPARDRPARLGAERTIGLPPRRPEGFLEVAALPAWELGRPRTWSSMAASVAQIRRLLAR